MNNRKAIETLTNLVQGLDPNTGQELPPDAVLQRADVLRALLVAIESLKAQSARQARRAQLPERVGMAWSSDEERRLVELFQAGSPLTDIAAEFDRTLRAVEARLEKLGLISRDQRQTRDSFG